MDINDIKYRVKTAVEKDIFSHLEVCNDLFLPPLSERVDLAGYANKIFEKAITFEAWKDDNLIGLIAVYSGDNIPKLLFITDVSVTKEYMGLHIASTLLKKCIDYAVEINCFEIHLEVNKGNIAAIYFYKKYNFIQSGTKEDNLLMKLEIK